MKILKHTALCGSCDCGTCPSVNLTDKGSFLVAGAKTDVANQVSLPLPEYVHAVNNMGYKDGCDVSPDHIDWENSAISTENAVLFSGRLLDETEHQFLAKPLSDDETAVEVSAKVFWSCYNQS